MRRFPTMNELCEKIETFFQKLKESGKAEIYDEELEPSSEEEISALEEGLGLELPADLRAWLARGCKVYQGSVDEPFAGIGFSFMKAERALEHTKMLRQTAAENRDEDDDEDEDEHAEIVNEGVALTYEEPEIVWTPHGVYSFSFRNPICRVAGSWTEFLGDWLASGAFSSHDIDAALAVTAPFVPEGSVSPEDNRWLKAYRALHGKSDSSASEGQGDDEDDD